MPYQSPRRIIIDPLQRECDLPEDPAWPAPTRRREAEELMRRLPHWAQVVCAVTAAEMVLPIWKEDDLVNETLSKEQIEAPGRAIEVIWKSLDGEIPQAETVDAGKAAAEAATASRAAGAGRGAGWAAQAAAEAAKAAADTTVDWTAKAAATAGWAARVAARGAGWVVIEFYREWWDFCRYRLASFLETFHRRA